MDAIEEEKDELRRRKKSIKNKQKDVGPCNSLGRTLLELEFQSKFGQEILREKILEAL